MRTLQFEVSDLTYELIELSRKIRGLDDELLLVALATIAEHSKDRYDMLPQDFSEMVRSAAYAVDSYLNPVQTHIDVMGSSPCVGTSRIPIWALVSLSKQGAADKDLLANYPTISQHHLYAAWQYYTKHSQEIDEEIAAQVAEEKVG